MMPIYLTDDFVTPNKSLKNLNKFKPTLNRAKLPALKHAHTHTCSTLRERKKNNYENVCTWMYVNVNTHYILLYTFKKKKF